MDLLLKDFEDAGGRVAVLEVGSEWVREEIVICAFFVRFQGIIENKLEVGRCQFSSSSVSVRHSRD